MRRNAYADAFESSGINSYLDDAFGGLAVALVISFFLLFAVMAVQFGFLRSKFKVYCVDLSVELFFMSLKPFSSSLPLISDAILFRVSPSLPTIVTDIPSAPDIKDLENFVVGADSGDGAKAVKLKDILIADENGEVIKTEELEACIRRTDGKQMVSVSAVLPGTDTGSAGKLMGCKRRHKNRAQTHFARLLHGFVLRRSAVSKLLDFFKHNLTTVLALIPLAIGVGQGSELMQPLGIVVIGGLLIGTLVTLVLVPAVYCAFYGVSK